MLLRRRAISRHILVALLLATGLAAARSDAAEDWRWRASLAPRALLYEGLWSDYFHPRKAADAAGMSIRAGYVSVSAYWGPGKRILGLSADEARLEDKTVVVLCNVDAPALGPERLADLRRFVENGGGLVVLGGHWAYSCGAYAGTPLEEMLPVEFPVERYLPSVRAGLALAPAPGMDWEPAADFAAKPMAFYVQRLEPKPGAKVQVLAGGKPAFITGKFGKGRVVACALTVNGEPPAGSTAFWDWEGWPKLLGEAIEWAGEDRPELGRRPAAAAEAGGLKPLTENEIDEVFFDPDVADKTFVARALVRPSAQVAEVLLELVVQEKEFCKLARIADALRPFASPEWAEKLAPLTDAMNVDVNERRAALLLLGAAGGKEAKGILTDAMKDSAVRPAAIEGLGLLGDAEVLPALRKVHAGALEAAESKEYPGRIDPDAFAREHGPVAAQAALALFRLGDELGLEKLLDANRKLIFYRRVYANAGKRRVRYTDTQGMLILKAIWDRAHRLSLAEARIHNMDLPVPKSQVKTFVRVAVQATDLEDVALLASLLEVSPAAFSAEELAALGKARSGLIRRLARELASSSRP